MNISKVVNFDTLLSLKLSFDVPIQQCEEFEKFKVGEYLLGFLFAIDFVVVIGGELGSGCFLCCLVDDHC